MKILNIILIIIILLVFKNWFISTEVIFGSDWPVLYKELPFSVPFEPQVYRTNFSLGQNIIPIMGVETYYLITAKIFFNFLPWAIIERVFWFFPFIMFCILGSYLFTRSFLGALIYTTNSYVLMIVDGGQMGVALSYSLLPFLLYLFKSIFYSIINKSYKNKISYWIGIIFSFAFILLIDIRVAYITIVLLLLYSVFFYIICNEVNRNKLLIIKNSLLQLLVLSIAIFLNFFWIFPLFVQGNNVISGIENQYKSSESVRFFSVALLENSFGFLHPNWPHNIFGKVGFMKPEFLLIPCIAYLFLIVPTNMKRYSVRKDTYHEKIFNDFHAIFFGSIIIIGAFLAKGVNDPFGFIYHWLYMNFPGFILFRDPTKWYILITIGYSFLIPYSIKKISELFKSKNSLLVFTSIFMFLWIVIHQEAFLGKLNGTIMVKKTPNEFIQLKDKISMIDTFSRSLWIPTMTPYTFTSSYHSGIEATFLFNSFNLEDMKRKILQSEFQEWIRNANIHYIIIPYYFETDKKRVNELYSIKRILDSYRWMERDKEFSRIFVYRVRNPSSKFLLKDNEVLSSYISPTMYKLQFKKPITERRVYFSEKYDPSWIMRTKDNQILRSEKFELINSFYLPSREMSSVDVYYLPQRTVSFGKYISIFTFVIVVLYSVIIFIKKQYD